MSVFLDTSALYAILDAGDANHAAAAKTWSELLRSGEDLITSSYVVIETDALVRRRMGMPIARRLHEDILPVVRTEWLGEAVHNAAVGAALATGRRGPSLVDCASFELIRTIGIDRVFAFDDHFIDRGYEIAP